MKPLKKQFFTIILILTTVLGNSQLSQPDLNKLIPPSPEVAALNKYIAQPVTLYEGMPAVSIPVYELKSIKLSVPIELTYNYNGYRPGEEATWIGMGWSLQAGGVISKMIRGKDDFNSFPDPLYTKHWDDYAMITDLTSNGDFIDDAGKGRADSEPDLYTFNFQGHSGKFILVGNKAFLFPLQDMVITYQADNTFKIVAEDGTTYYFGTGVNDAARETTIDNGAKLNYTSSWQLSRIVSVDLSDEIDFNYVAWNYHQYNNNLAEAYTTSTEGGLLHSTSWGAVGYSNTNISAKRLASIDCKTATVFFNPEDNTRLDLHASSTGSYALKEIKIHRKVDAANVFIKTINLTHDYFKYAQTKTQLKLTGLTVTGSFNNLTATESYSFQYKNETADFPKATTGIDKWGYYNGAVTNGMLFDNSLGLPSYIRAPANREVDPNYCVYGCLNKIIYPTGGYSTFDYQNNQLSIPGNSQYVHETRTIGDIVFFSSIGNNTSTSISGSFVINETQSVNIDYARDISNHPNGIINNQPILTICKIDPNGNNGEGACVNPWSVPVLNQSVSSGTTTKTLDPGTYTYTITCENTTISATAHIRYYWVNTSQLQFVPGPGMRIASIKSFDNVNSTSAAITKNYTYGSGAILLNTLGAYGLTSRLSLKADLSKAYLESHTEYTYSSDYGSPNFCFVGNNFYYPSVTEINKDETGSGKTIYTYVDNGSNDGLNIALKEQDDYTNGISNPIHKTVNNYNTVNRINFPAFSVYQSAQSQGMALSSPYPYDIKIRTELYAPVVYTLSSNISRLTSSIETIADENGQNPFTNETDYFYDNPDHLQPTRKITTNSKGQTVTTQIKYPWDYSTSCNSLYDIDLAYNSSRLSASSTYTTCVSNRIAAADYAFRNIDQTIPYSSNTAVINAESNYTCENDYKSGYQTVKNTLNNNYSNYTTCNTVNAGVSAYIGQMRIKNIVSPVEQIASINKSGNDYFINALKTDYNSTGIFPKVISMAKHAQSDILLSSFVANPNNYYDPKVNFTYNNDGNLYHQYKTNDGFHDYIWDYDKSLPVAEIIWNKPPPGDYPYYYAYTSFESSGSGNWTISGGAITTATSPTGTKCYQLDNGTISISGLDPAQPYWLTYWTKNANSYTINGTTGTKGEKIGQWTYYEHKIQPAGGNISITGTGYIDELRLYIDGAQMTTYAYAPLIGLTSQCDVNNKITYYDYDGLGRLKLVIDQDKNILKKICYNYAGQLVNCDATIYYNDEQHNTYAKNNCANGYYGSAIFYSVPAGKYSSTNSLTEANNLATADMQANGQNYANTTGNCIPQINVNLTSVNSIGAGFIATYTRLETNTTYKYSVPVSGGTLVPQNGAPAQLPAGIYNLTISKSNNTSSYSYNATCGGTNLWKDGTSATFYYLEINCTTHTIILSATSPN